MLQAQELGCLKLIGYYDMSGENIYIAVKQTYSADNEIFGQTCIPQKRMVFSELPPALHLQLH